MNSNTKLNDYQKNLAEYNKTLAEIKGQRDQLSQKINDWKELSGQSLANEQKQTVNTLNGRVLRDFSKQTFQLNKQKNNYHDVSGMKKASLIDFDRVTQLQSDNLNNNLGQFHRIESDVNTKSRLAELNQEEHEKKNKTVKALLGFGVLALSFILLVASWRAEMINFLTFSAIFVAGMGAYLIYLVYYLNLFRAQTITKAAIADFEVLAEDVKNGVQIVRGDIARGIFGNSPVCPECPSGKKSGSKKPSLPIDDMDGGIVRNDNAVWFSTNSAPPQKILPMDDSNIEEQIPRDMPGPKFDIRPNSCLLDWKKKKATGMPKPSYSDTSLGECIPWQFHGAARNQESI